MFGAVFCFADEALSIGCAYRRHEKTIRRYVEVNNVASGVDFLAETGKNKRLLRIFVFNIVKHCIP